MAGAAFIAFGAHTLTQNTSTSSAGMQSILTISVGSLLAAQSCFLCIGGACTDRVVERILDELREHNEELKSSILVMANLTQRYEMENGRLRSNVEQFSEQNEKLSERADDLKKSAHQLRSLNDEYTASLARSSHIVEEMAEKIKSLEQLRDDAEAEIESLRGLIDEQKRQIEALAQQAENLNNLQRQSVKMIQQLALYGDKAKSFGVSLADVSKELRETDESLGLTSEEMRKQLIALEKVTEALTRTDRTLRRRKRKKASAAAPSEPLLEASDENV